MITPSAAFFAQFDDEKLVAADKAHYVHGYHVFDDHRENGALNIAAGQGAYIYDTKGNLRLYSRYGSGAEALLSDIRLLLKQA